MYLPQERFQNMQGFKKQHKLICAEKLRHNEFNKFKFQLKISYTQYLLEKMNKIKAQNTQYVTYTIRLNVCDCL